MSARIRLSIARPFWTIWIPTFHEANLINSNCELANIMTEESDIVT